jgi:hypothetical protein
MKKFIVLGIATKKADKLERELPSMSADDKTVMRYDTKEEAAIAYNDYIAKNNLNYILNIIT